MMALPLLLPAVVLLVMHSELGNVLLLAQYVPPIACPQYFDYLSYNGQYLGRITIQHDPRFANSTLFVEFSQRESLNSAYVGSLSLSSDPETTKYNLANGIPIQYRVDFPTPGILPKLTQIVLNDALLCSAPTYPPPNTRIALTHTLTYAQGPLRANAGGPVFEPPRRQVTAVQQPQRRTQPTQPQLVMQNSRTRTALVPQNAERPTAGLGPAQINAVCGQETQLGPLIFHGKVVRRGKLPWVAAIHEKQTNGLSFFCGGTLVSQSTVVTAAHCFRVSRVLPANRAVVSLGRTSLDEYSGAVLRDIEIVLVHQQYRSESFSDADIALLKLVEPVTFTDFIKPICLWSESYRLVLPSGYKSYVAGWGADENGNANTKVLKMADTDILTESECLRQLPITRLVTPRTICATNAAGAGPCNGDSGGGLMLNENNIWVLRGIVSAGQSLAETCDLSKPVIYCDVAKHIEWVRSSMWY